MFCTKCGAQVPDHHTFCSKCGAKLAAPVAPQPPVAPQSPVAPQPQVVLSASAYRAPQPPQATPPVPPPAPSQPPKKSGSGLRVALIVVICLLVVAVTVIAILLFGGKDASEDEEETTRRRGTTTSETEEESTEDEDFTAGNAEPTVIAPDASDAPVPMEPEETLPVVETMPPEEVSHGPMYYITGAATMNGDDIARFCDANSEAIHSLRGAVAMGPEDLVSYVEEAAAEGVQYLVIDQCEYPEVVFELSYAFPELFFICFDLEPVMQLPENMTILETPTHQLGYLVGYTLAVDELSFEPTGSVNIGVLAVGSNHQANNRYISGILQGAQDALAEYGLDTLNIVTALLADTGSYDMAFEILMKMYEATGALRSFTTIGLTNADASFELTTLCADFGLNYVPCVYDSTHPFEEFRDVFGAAPYSLVNLNGLDLLNDQVQRHCNGNLHEIRKFGGNIFSGSLHDMTDGIDSSKIEELGYDYRSVYDRLLDGYPVLMDYDFSKATGNFTHIDLGEFN